MMKVIPWKSTVVPPIDAKRPICKAITTTDGINGILEAEETDQIDWLIVIGYETESEIHTLKA